MQYFLSIDGLVTGIVALVFGILIIVKDRKNKVNQTLFLLTIATAFWSFGYWQWLSVVNDGESALFWCRMLSIGSLFIPVFYFHWILTLLDFDKKRKGLLFASYSFAFICLLFSFSDFFVNRVEPIEGYFTFWPKPGWLYSIYLFTIYSGLVIYSVVLLFKAYIESYGLKKLQIRYVLLGTIFGFGGGATNFFLWYDIPILPIGNILVISYPILFTYSIVKHRLMDIKMVLRTSSVYLMSLISIIGLAVGVKLIFDYYFPSISYWTDLSVLILAISIFPSIKNKYFLWANLYFFSSLYDPQKLIARLSDRLRTTLQIDRIYDYIFKSLDDAFHVKAFGVLSYDEKKKVYSLDFNKGFEIGRQKKFINNPQLHEMFIGRNKIIVTEEVRRSYYNEQTKEIIDLLTALKVEVLIPLNVKDRTVGLIALGPKESNDMYNDTDLQTLEIVSAQAATAIENAWLYEKTLNFNIKLREEVKRATEDLRTANEKLKKLDEAKSEFISIASHQLRTPLTIIKGYISMILEGNFGELTPGETESLKKVYSSNERLIQLVENLLNISRIESGRLQFNYEVMPLETLVDSVMEELQTKAKEKDLKLVYKKHKHLLKVKIDQEKIRQVAMNLIDNSIKYTKKGSVTVVLQKVEDPELGPAVEFSVSDSGMGIRPEDLPNLFKKFSRGTGTSLIHTEDTGLGLYVARQMVEAHHGKVWAESPGEGKGSKFFFRLPAEK